MLLSKKNVKNIKKNKVTFIKNFTQIENIYDFNKLSVLIDNYSLPVENKTNQLNTFNSIWQLKNIHKLDSLFFTYIDFLQKIFKYNLTTKDGVDLFFSFVTNIGVSHADTEDVFLIGLYGNTIYRVIENNKDFILEKGDLLFVPKGTQHKAISLTPRVVASVGYFGGKLSND